MPKRAPEPAGMTPLQALILDRMRERQWSPQDVEKRGIAHATLHRYMKPLVMKSPPRRDIMQKLANALDLPLSRVEQAADASVERNYRIVVDTSADDLTMVIATMQDSPEARKKLVEIARQYHQQMREEQQRRNGGQL